MLKKGWVSQDVADNTKSTYEQAQAQTEVDRATIQQRQAELATAAVNLSYSDIVSPVDGVILAERQNAADPARQTAMPAPRL